MPTAWEGTVALKDGLSKLMCVGPIVLDSLVAGTVTVADLTRAVIPRVISALNIVLNINPNDSEV